MILYLDIKLKHILRCHSKGESNYKNDYSSPVYCATFLPKEGCEPNTTIICTGGAHKICFIDCGKGKAIKLFQASPSESFYCIAASFIPKYLPKKNSPISDSIIVAAAGKQKTIKLIHFQRNECFSVLSGHSGTINELEFSPKTPHHLISRFLKFDI